jgi:hypothetical protein
VWTPCGLCTDSMRICGLLADSARTPCGDCKVQKLSQAARESMLKEVKTQQDEIEDSGIEGLNSQGVLEMEQLDLEQEKDCCM